MTSRTIRKASRSRGSPWLASNAARIGGKRSSASGPKTRSNGVGRVDSMPKLNSLASGGAEAVQDRGEGGERFDVGDVAAVGEGVKGGAKRVGHGAGGVGRNRVVLAVENRRGDGEGGERGAKIVVAETLPDFLLGPAGDAERGEIAGAGRIMEVGRHAQLEDAASVRVGVPFAKSARPERGPLGLQQGIEVPPRELPLEPLPCFPPGRRGRHQRHPLDPVGVLGRVEEREERAPGISGDAEPLDSPEYPERLEIRYLLPPPDRHVAPHGRAAAASLVVVDKGAAGGQRIETGEEVVVVGAGSAVEHHAGRAVAGSPLEERDPADLPGCGLLR